MTYTVWKDLGLLMSTQNYANYYFTPENYKADKNPLEILVVPPDIESFFGTRVLNLFIVGKPYGWKKSGGTWSEDWPPDGLQEAIDRHKLLFPQFTKYRTVIFMDNNLVNKIMDESPNSRFAEMMSTLKGHLFEICTQLQEFGFEMGPDIENEVGADFFAPYIDPHYDYIHAT